MPAPILIAKVVQGIIGLLTNLTDPEQYDIAKLKQKDKAIEAGEKYIFVDEKSGKFKGIDADRQQKLKKHYRKRFFHYS